MNRILTIVGLTLCAASVWAGEAKVALIGDQTTESTQSIIDLTTAELASRGVSLLERTEIEGLLKEQGYGTVAATREDALQLGRLLEADLLAIITAATADDTWSGDVVVFDARTGLRLSDVEHVSHGPEAIVSAMADAVQLGCTKHATRGGELLTIGIVPVRLSGATSRLHSRVDVITRSLERRLTQSPAVAVLERKRLGSVVAEQHLGLFGDSTGKDRSMAGATHLLEIECSALRSTNALYELTYWLTEPGKERVRLESIDFGPTELTTVIDRVVTGVLAHVESPALAEKPPSARVLHQDIEAARFAQEAEVLLSQRRFADAFEMASAAFVLHATPAQSNLYMNSLVSSFKHTFFTERWTHANTGYMAELVTRFEEMRSHSEPEWHAPYVHQIGQLAKKKNFELSKLNKRSIPVLDGVFAFVQSCRESLGDAKRKQQPPGGKGLAVSRASGGQEQSPSEEEMRSALLAAIEDALKLPGDKLVLEGTAQDLAQRIIEANRDGLGIPNPFSEHELPDVRLFGEIIDLAAPGTKTDREAWGRATIRLITQTTARAQSGPAGLDAAIDVSSGISQLLLEGSLPPVPVLDAFVVHLSTCRATMLTSGYRLARATKQGKTTTGVERLFGQPDWVHQRRKERGTGAGKQRQLESSFFAVAGSILDVLRPRTGLPELYRRALQLLVVPHDPGASAKRISSEYNRAMHRFPDHRSRPTKRFLPIGAAQARLELDGYFYAGDANKGKSLRKIDLESFEVTILSKTGPAMAPKKQNTLGWQQLHFIDDGYLYATYNGGLYRIGVDDGHTEALVEYLPGGYAPHVCKSGDELLVYCRAQRGSTAACLLHLDLSTREEQTVAQSGRVEPIAPLERDQKLPVHEIRASKEGDFFVRQDQTWWRFRAGSNSWEELPKGSRAPGLAPYRMAEAPLRPQHTIWDAVVGCDVWFAKPFRRICLDSLAVEDLDSWNSYSPHGGFVGNGKAFYHVFGQGWIYDATSNAHTEVVWPRTAPVPCPDEPERRAWEAYCRSKRCSSACCADCLKPEFFAALQPLVERAPPAKHELGVNQPYQVLHPENTVPLTVIRFGSVDRYKRITGDVRTLVLVKPRGYACELMLVSPSLKTARALYPNPSDGYAYEEPIGTYETHTHGDHLWSSDYTISYLVHQRQLPAGADYLLVAIGKERPPSDVHIIRPPEFIPRGLTRNLEGGIVIASRGSRERLEWGTGFFRPISYDNMFLEGVMTSRPQLVDYALGQLAEDASFRIRRSGSSVLGVAADLPMMEHLVAAGADASDGAPLATFVMQLSGRGEVQGVPIIRYLLDQGADINAMVPAGFLEERSPAMFAADKRKGYCLVALVQAGADLSQQSAKGMNVLDYAKARRTPPNADSSASLPSSIRPWDEVVQWLEEEYRKRGLL